MIPKIIHQTWRDHAIPEPTEWPESWRLKNPDWEYKLWTDDDLNVLLRDHYPELKTLFFSYPKPVQRADLGRYLILHHCGGVYADLDTECLTSLDPITSDTRVILSEEPIEHHHHALTLGMTKLVFNGVMASPKGHPFWLHLMKVLLRCQHGKVHVLESTGPLALSGALESFAEPSTIGLNSCHLFNPLTVKGYGSLSPLYGDYSSLRISNHYWGSSWFTEQKPTRVQRIKRAFRKAKYYRNRGPQLTRSELEQRIDMSELHQPIVPTDTNVSILIPIRDAEPFLDRCFDLLLALKYPKDRLKIVFCEGDTIDDTVHKLRHLIEQHQDKFRAIEVATLQGNNDIQRSKRWLPHLQFSRRSTLARVRNHLINKGLKRDDHWALWIDVDVCDYDPNIIGRLLAEKSKVVTPDCVLEWGGPSYDLSAFNDDREIRDHAYYKHVKAGLYMPPADHYARRHLHDFRFIDRVPLSSVGGTMLLVHASVHHAGVRFPELLYDDLLETEGFGRICRNFGVQPIGLPNIQIRHVVS
tara:strand:+ start:1345 stop:2925 length:1581 start_codon:yes stop_codon:yes gene_type:complete